MANLIRSPKSGSGWTSNDLASYHISLQQQEALQFFGVQVLEVLPQPVVDPEILNTLDAEAMHQDNHIELISLLELAMIPTTGETAVVDFVVVLFKYLGYVREGRLARTRVKIPLHICGEARKAKTSVCLVDRFHNDIILLVQEDRRLENTAPIHARAKLVAEAVAAFTENNANRDTMGLPPLAEKVIPGIVMAGTMPTFFKIPVTQTLAKHIAHGTYPPAETVVTYCYPPVPRPASHHSEGMKPLDNRREVLRCYEAFKTIVGI